MSLESDAEVREFLGLETIAVVGCSRHPGKAAHDVPKYMLEHGYDVIPVNPFAEEIFGRPAYDHLAEVTQEVDIVNVFRPSEEAGEVIDAALERDDAPVIWLQLGIRNDEGATRAEAAGRRVIQDRCIKVDHQRLLG